jgi:tetratricopeptide (TPR) repeat protein
MKEREKGQIMMMRISQSVFVVFFVIILLTCSKMDKGLPGLPDLPEGAQAISLLSDTLRIPELTGEVSILREEQLRKAEADLNVNPEDADAAVWYGRRLAYLGRYREAITFYTASIAKHPNDPRFYRHRGHRYITLRLFNQAIPDFRRAAELMQGKPDEIEPDGLPNARNIPLSTLHFNVWYHHGLAYYLKGDFERALSAYEECMKVSKNPDLLVATTHWYYMTLRRLGRHDEATRLLEPVHADMDIIENGSYHRLLLFYKGELEEQTILSSPTDALDNATVGYGVGHWHHYNGRIEEARQIYEGVVQGSQWTAFGYIAAEAELSRF